MVSGFVTSPCDQLRIFSGEARLIRMLSKSEMLFPRSNGLERYKVSSVAQMAQAPSPVSGGLKAPCYESLVQISQFRLRMSGTAEGGCAERSIDHLVCRCCQRLLVAALDQLNIETERLQFANKNIE